MKKYFATLAVLFVSVIIFAQPGKKPAQKQPAQSEMDKAMEEAMKDMSPEEKAEMKKIMGNVMPDLMGQNSKMADYPEFTSNKQLVPKKDMTRINAIPKKKLSQADMSPYAGNLYNKIMTKGNAAEIAIVKKVIAQSSKANELGSAAILCMMQGHPQAAMALSMKAVQTDPFSANWQNNMASLLTQYGYPEQAVPVLQKLKTQFPTNSTVLNNLAYAWLGLGETDSAKTYSGYAIRANPNHPDAKLCGGLMEEIKGDPIKATDDYVESMENSVNPFTETMIKNNKGQGKLDKIDFEKIKRSIAIYEYLPRDWMLEIPLLSSDVNGYANDYATKTGYDKMSNRLTEKIEAMTNELSKELENLADKGEDEFVKTMAKETMQGLSFMSKPAVSVLMVLMNYLKDWMLKYADETQKVVKLKEEYNQVYQNTINNLKGEQRYTCPKFNAAANEYMRAVNPMVKKFFREKAEEFRQWVNAYITWNWYVAGNPKNSVMIQDLGFVGLLEQMYQSAMEYQVAIDDHCKPPREQGSMAITEPEIPNFACPAVVSIPMGRDWQQLSNAAKNFDNNTSGIKQNAHNPIPNSSIAFGEGTGTIAQPGRSPFVKTANGSVSPGMISEYDPGKMLEEYQYTEDLVPLPDLHKNNFVKKLLKKMMTADCKNVNKYKYKPPVFEVTMGELTIEEPSKNIKETTEDGNVVYVTYDDGSVAVFMEDGSILEIDAPSKNVKETKEDGNIVYVTYDDGSEAVFMEDGSILEIDAPKDSGPTVTKKITIKPKTTTPDIASKNKVYTDLKEFKKQFDTNGLQPSLNSGVQVPGTFTPVKGLFN